jgi:hypothetical protein
MGSRDIDSGDTAAKKIRLGYAMWGPRSLWTPMGRQEDMATSDAGEEGTDG